MIPTQYSQLNSFLDYLLFQKRYSKHTIIAYKKDVENFLLFINDEFNSNDIKDTSSAMVRTWLAKLKEKKITSKSINRKISSLKSFFKFLMKEGVIDSTPMAIILSPKVNKRLPVYVEEKDMKTLFDYIEFTDDWKGRTERLIIELFYNTGLRVSELITLKINQVDFANNYIKVLGKGNKERIIPAKKEFLNKLHDYINEKPVCTQNNNLIFISEKGKTLYSKQVYNIVKKYLTLVTTVQKRSPHILRHSFATHLTNHGADLNAIKELLGHSSLAATQIYTHNSIEKLKDVFNKAHPKA